MMLGFYIYNQHKEGMVTELDYNTSSCFLKLLP